MRIRPVEAADLPPLVDLVIETFRPFYEGFVRPLYGEEIFEHQHGRWEQDYRDEVPALHDPSAGKHLAVAEDDGAIVGCVAWNGDRRTRHGTIYLVAVVSAGRRQQVGRTLCEHAIADLRTAGIDVVGIGTGDDAFHAAARGLYESMGFLKVPTAGYLKRI